jgi:ABC-type multidrug transport system fused ATPase/permease subunit
VSEARKQKSVSWQACRLIFRYALPRWKGWLIIVAGTLLSAAFGLLQPWPMKILVDHVLAAQPIAEPLATIVRPLPAGGVARGLLLWVVLAELVIFLVNSLADLLLTRTWLRVGQRMVYDLAADLFARLHVAR